MIKKKSKMKEKGRKAKVLRGNNSRQKIIKIKNGETWNELNKQRALKRKDNDKKARK